MRDWYQRWQFKRACHRWRKNASPESLIIAIERIPVTLYTTYRPADGLSCRQTFQYPTIEHYLEGLRTSLDIVQQSAYVTTKKTRHPPQTELLDAYMSTITGYSLPLSILSSDVLMLYRRLAQAIQQHPEERARYYWRQFQHQTQELIALLEVTETLLKKHHTH